ncbi:MAG: site-specific integrase [Deltaproteobacteria bacterium]|nr:site-specific integrase [Deltaproteobacteria bacterium]
MSKHNPTNERIKREYFTFLKEAKRQAEASIDGVAQALARFEGYTGYRDFKAFHHQQAVNFKRHLAEQTSSVTGAKWSKATIYATLTALKRFFQWLAGQPGYKSRLKYSDADFFNPSEKDTRIATARRERPFPTIEQVKHVIAAMPSNTEIQRRDRAVVAFTLLTGARDSAIASMSLKHVDLAASSVNQDARDVKTKFSKTFTTAFFPVGEEIVHIVEDWVTHLRQEKLWGNDDPLFPATKVIVGEGNRFEVAGLKRNHWSNATAIRKIFRAAFEAVGLSYFHPHSLRNTLVQLGEKLCKTPEEFKAWSQNLGHEKVLTTFCSYGQVATARQGEIIRDLGKPRQLDAPHVSQLAKELAREMANHKIDLVSANRE